jgi:Mn2+/Fe2+ NRAMP family transporter
MIRKLGPGLLFAAAAVGVSHLVQSTRAGAEFGLTMAALIILACLIKYPAFRFGAEYAAAAGESLIVGYERQGRWLLMFSFVALAIEGLTVIPAVSLVAAGMTMRLASIDLNETVFTMGMIIVCSIGLALGRYRLLERTAKVLVALFAVLSVVAALVAAATIGDGQSLAAPIPPTEENLFFAVAVAGWMPVGMGGAVFLSLWVRAKADALQRPIEIGEARFDFNVGYVTTMGIALCFLLMGSVLLFGADVELASNAVGFASQLVGLFASTVGAWVTPIIGVSALAVMFSTVLTVIDGFARVYTDVTGRLFDTRETVWTREHLYVGFMVFQALVAWILLLFFLQSFGAFIDFATTVGFLVAPVIAFLNHRIMCSESIAQEARPARWLRYWSITGVTVLTLVSIVYLFFRLS